MVENNSSSAAAPYSETYWVTSITVLSVLTTIAVYILLAVLAYIFKNRSHLIRPVDRRKRHSYLLACSTLGLLLAVCRYIADYYTAFYGWRSDQDCYTTVKISTAFYYCSIFMVYMFLWFRQSIIYRHKLLSHMVQPFTRVLSNLILVLMLISFVVVVPLLVFSGITGENYKVGAGYCREKSQQNFSAVFLSQSVMAIVFQVSLIVLFVYPLCKQQRAFAVHFSPTSSPHVSVKTTRHFDFNDLNHESVHSEVTQTSTMEMHSAVEGSTTEMHSAVEGNLSSDVLQDAVQHRTKDVADDHSGEVESVQGSERKSLEKEDTQNNKPPALRINTNENNTTSFTDEKILPALILTGSQMTPPTTPTKTKEDSVKSRHNDGSVKSQPGRLDRDHWLRRSGRVLQRVASTSIRSNKKSITKIMAFIRKATILSVICVTSDVVFTIAHEVIEGPHLLEAVLFDCNLLICTLCILLTFSDWSLMLFPFLSKKSHHSLTRRGSETSISCISSTLTNVPASPR